MGTGTTGTSRIRMVLVDDSAAFLELAGQFFDGHPVVEVVGSVRSGPEAIETVEQLVPDVVLMDLAMPGMSGLEATRRIKTLARAPRVIIVTLHCSTEYREAARAVGADGFMAKGELVEQAMPMIGSVCSNLEDQQRREVRDSTVQRSVRP